MTSQLSSAMQPLTPPDPSVKQCEKHCIALQQDPVVRELDGSPQWWCPRCSEEEIARVAAADHERRDRERLAERQLQRQRALEARIGAAGIPTRYRGFSFDTFPGTTLDAKQRCAVLRSYALNWKTVQAEGLSVILSGATGTGKTGLACSVANLVMREFGATAQFMSAYGAVRHLRDTWGRRGRTEREALHDLIGVDLLILDELGASVGSDTEMTALFEVINGRYAEQRPTMLLSNLPLADRQAPGGETRPGLNSYLGPRIMDRFRDDGSFVLNLDWPSLRGAAA
jgi:DNA replication protein DnaC